MKKFFSKKSTLLALSLLILFLILSTKKVFQYAFSPVKPKDCTFTYPKNSDQTKPVTIASDLSPVYINDASCLNKTRIHSIVSISSVDDIQTALETAREQSIKVTPAGQQHSMGGQSFLRGGVVLDMKKFNQMTLNKEAKILTVQSGARWADIQQFLDKEGLAVQAMQSINIFTVGGTLSVNAHGIAHDPGQIASTVRSMRVMLSDGRIVNTSPAENVELFRHVLGGYGLFGVILDVDLEVVENDMYAWKREFMSYLDFPEYYKNNIQQNPNIGLMYGRLSMSPASFLKETIVHRYEKIPFDGERPALETDEHTWINRLVMNVSKTGGFGRSIRWMLEKYAEPHLHICSRNQAMSQKEVCLVSRNQEMYDSMGYLKNKLKDTDILQEYFIPHEKMPAFIDGLRDVVQKNNANLINVTIRIVSQDTVTALPYAREDMFAFVLYFNQKLNERESAILEKTTVDLIDLAASLDGTFYLPYQLYYSPEQLRAAYPEIDRFFATKKIYDPIGLFSNTWYEKYL